MTSEGRDSRPADVRGDEARPSTSARTSKKGRKQLPLWQETILLLVTALGLAIVIKAFFVQAFYIPSESMEPGLVQNDRILVEKPSYWGSAAPERGDVVVFKDPGGWLDVTAAAGPESPLARLMVKVGLYPAGGHLVKRVIGVEGDTVECCDDRGRIQVNGEPLNEQGYVKGTGQLQCNGPMPAGEDHCSWQSGPVPQGSLFVMGDNRSRSADSSVHLCSTDATDCVDGAQYVSTDLVVGKVFVLLWPWDRFTWVGRPDALADVPDGSSTP